MKIQLKYNGEKAYPVIENNQEGINDNTFINEGIDNCLIKTGANSTIYVNANYDDGGDGSIDAPFNDLQTAINATTEETDIYVQGVLRPSNTINIPQDKQVNIIGGTIKGSMLNTQMNRNCGEVAKIYVGDICPQWIFVNGNVRYPASTNREKLVRVPCSGSKNEDVMTSVINIPVNDAVKLSEMDTTNVWITVLWMWMSYKCRITRIDTSTGKIYCEQTIGTANSNVLHTFSGNLRIILENANISECEMFDGKDLWQSGTYYVEDGYLYYKFRIDEDVFGNIEIPRIETLISSEGKLGLYNCNISQTNHIFDNTCNEGEHCGYSGRQACAFFNAAIELNNESIIKGCTFTYTTNHAIKLFNEADNCVIADNNFENLGCSSVVIGKVNLRFKRDIPTKCPVNTIFENNIILSPGRIYAGACGISIFYGDSYKVRYNLVRNTYYTGITTGYTWNTDANPNKNGLIEYNVFDLIGVGGQELYDGGAFYNLGNANGLVFRNNIITNVYGDVNSSINLDGFFIDESSSNITITNNLFYHCNKFYRFNTTTSTVYVRNNIFCDDFKAVTLKNSGVIENNVFIWRHNPTVKGFNNNIWVGESQEISWDDNAKIGNPFVDYENKDFRITNQELCESANFVQFTPQVKCRLKNPSNIKIIKDNITSNWHEMFK